MDSLYDQLLALNAVPGAFEGWREYREAFTAFIAAHTEGGGSCLLVGAGACSDIDLAVLSKHFDTITLLDTDTAAMALAQKRCPAENITALRADLLGVPENAYRALSDAMLSALRMGESGAALTERFLKETERMLKNACPDPLPTADTVLCCGVHSQLLAIFARMAAVYARYGNMDTQRVFEAISRHNAALQPVFNGRLLFAARKTLILGLETERVGVPGGIEGAAQALRDFSARGLKTEETEMLWPFNPMQGKLYRMRVLAVDTRAED